MNTNLGIFVEFGCYKPILQHASFAKSLVLMITMIMTNDNNGIYIALSHFQAQGALQLLLSQTGLIKINLYIISIGVFVVGGKGGSCLSSPPFSGNFCPKNRSIIKKYDFDIDPKCSKIAQFSTIFQNFVCFAAIVSDLSYKLP